MRAERARQATRDAAERSVVFWAGERCLAIAISGVREVVDLARVTPVPGAPPGILGIASLRGTILAVADTSFLFTGQLAPRPASKLLVLVRDEVVVAGLTVDRVHGILAITGQRALADHAASAERFVRARHDLGLAVIVSELDPGALNDHIESLRLVTAATATSSSD